ncbi:hypothetical protein [Treponema sp. Marseille-Q4523]|nr:hypothetical protein [Treponema sp. Marseille-Q4523]MBM7022690.1 hypothetical protein [Treponema sp. Marseille-Q4523]
MDFIGFRDSSLFKLNGVATGVSFTIGFFKAIGSLKRETITASSINKTGE